jgi:hypothetical protein
MMENNHVLHVKKGLFSTVSTVNIAQQKVIAVVIKKNLHLPNTDDVEEQKHNTHHYVLTHILTLYMNFAGCRVHDVTHMTVSTW